MTNQEKSATSYSRKFWLDQGVMVTEKGSLLRVRPSGAIECLTCVERETAGDLGGDFDLNPHILYVAPCIFCQKIQKVTFSVFDPKSYTCVFCKKTLGVQGQARMMKNGWWVKTLEELIKIKTQFTLNQMEMTI